jgi:signal transduction histidine kinase/CHASE3 domain sensor protein
VRFGLAARILIAGGIVAAFSLAEFALVVRGFQAVRSHTRAEQRAGRSAIAAVQLEKLILDLETGSRGYVISRDPSFLESWRSAQRQLPAQSRLLEALAPGPLSAAVAAQWQSYLRDWSIPTVDLAARQPEAARAKVATGAGQRRVARIRRLIDPFVVREEQVAAQEQERIADAEHEGVLLGVGGILVTVLLFGGTLAYFMRFAVNPVRRIVDATHRVAGGEHGVEVPERAVGEVGQLAVAFNDMSRSLVGHQEELAQQNVDLERLANMLRAVLDSTVDGILLSDEEGNVQLANRPVVKLTRDLGMSYEGTVVDRLLSVAHRVRDPEKYRAAMERLRDDPTQPTFDEFEDVVSGRVFQGFTAPVLDDRGGFLGRIWTLREVTEQRELDRLKDDFVATVSHELRTPLTSMMGFLEMIREGEAGELTGDQQRFLAIVYRSSERLQRLVGDLLFVARLDANGLQLQFRDVNIDEVVRETAESSIALARSRELDLRVETGDVPPVLADRERLGQLVGNLVSNALKFTPAGGAVTLRTYVDNGRAAIDVEDTGIGIPEPEQDRLFQRFFRSSTATEQAIPGTGLGLVIAKAIAEGHGGSISVRSAPGEGTCFSVRLPLEPEEVAA